MRFCVPFIASKRIEIQNLFAMKPRICFALKWLFALQAASICLLVLVLWLRTDTIFYSDKSCDLRLPDGKVVRTNRWFRGKAEEGFGLLQTSTEQEWLLIQHGDTSIIAIVTFDGVGYEAIVTHFTSHGPRHRAEFWIHPKSLSQLVE